MNGLKIAIIGAGSLYTSELLEGFVKNRNSLPVEEIALMDIDEKRLKIMSGFCKRYALAHGLDVKFTVTMDLKEAIKEASFVNIQIRTGGNAARIIDEKIPLSHGLIGQETTGAGGFFSALRQIPPIIEIARCVEKINQEAWIINYSNPSGIITEAILKNTKVKVAGFCAGGIFPEYWTRKALHLDKELVQYDYIGLNHLSFAYNLRVDGKTLTEEEFRKVIRENPCIDPEISMRYHAVLSPYFQYFYHTQKVLKKLEDSEMTRGEVVQKIERQILEEYADNKNCEKSALLNQRGGGGYSEVALRFMEAVYFNKTTTMVVNTLNKGTLPFLPDDACVEISCMVNKDGIWPLKTKIPRKLDWGLISAVKNYEQLTVDTAVNGDAETAILALMAHPLVRDYQLSKTIFEEMAEQFKEYLPQFQKKM